MRLAYGVKNKGGALELVTALGPPLVSPVAELPPVPAMAVVLVEDNVTAAEGFRLAFVRDDEAAAVPWTASALRLVLRVSEDADGS